MKMKNAVRAAVCAAVGAWGAAQGAPLADVQLPKGFTARMKVDLSSATRNETLWTMGPATLSLRMAGTDAALGHYDRAHGNYLNFRLADGTCPVLEATLAAAAGRIGVPLGALKSPGGVHMVSLTWAPPRWRICVDGDAADEDFPDPRQYAALTNGPAARVLSSRVSDAHFAEGAPRGVPPPEPDARPVARPIQYWTPDGHNTWTGDVAPAFLGGKLHVFYLIDRRHHGSGGGTGRHQFAHLETDDLVHWTERPLAVPIREWWQTVGTGTPFLKDGKLAIAFGWHTSRFGELAKDRPIGGTYAISEDGIHFTNSGEIVSAAQNPSIYTRADGTYELVTSYGGAAGVFRSKDLKTWTPFDVKVPFRGDCPSLFEWHGHRYLLQGFHGMAYSANGEPGTLEDWSGRPGKLYEGLSVPMVTPWKNDRRLYVGWLNHVHGWGGWLVFRELVQFPDGELGLKWVPEIQPPVKPVTLRTTGGCAFRRRFARVGGGDGLFLRIDPGTRTAEFVDDRPGAAPEQASIANNVRIGNVRGLEHSVEVRLVVWHDPKADATIFDAEIGGARTLICRRAGKWALEPLP